MHGEGVMCSKVRFVCGKGGACIVKWSVHDESDMRGKGDMHGEGGHAL